MLGLLKSRGRLRVSDTCTRADSSTTMGSAETGQVWTAQNGTWGISSNQAYCLSTTVGQSWSVSVDSGLSDMTYSGEVQSGSGGTGRYAGLVFRQTNATNYLIFNFDNNLNQVELYRYQSGIFNSLGTYAVAIADNTIYTLKVVCVGSSVQCYIDSALALSVTETFNQTATMHGLWVYSNEGSGCRFRNLLVIR